MLLNGIFCCFAINNKNNNSKSNNTFNNRIRQLNLCHCILCKKNDLLLFSDFSENDGKNNSSFFYFCVSSTSDVCLTVSNENRQKNYIRKLVKKPKNQEKYYNNQFFEEKKEECVFCLFVWEMYTLSTGVMRSVARNFNRNI